VKTWGIRFVQRDRIGSKGPIFPNKHSFIQTPRYLAEDTWPGTRSNALTGDRDVSCFLTVDASGVSLSEMSLGVS
jgi:hypothetical protein